ncbi:hypothetical protein H0H93_002349 [Arthromyces matolae]|nr:hypothetical protein H0H93_002349 [Arthromyces matolae]
MPPLDETRVLIARTIEELPVLTGKDIPDDADSCPICLTPFTVLFQDDTGDEPGVTKLITCNHFFCRKDLTQWIRSLHGNCPTCRHVFLDIRPPSESDDESSDGGEYIPDDLDEDDQFSDAFGYTTDEMDYDAPEWDDRDERDTDMDDVVFGGADDDSEWGLTDGESSMASEDVHVPFILNEAGWDGGDADEVEVGFTLTDEQSSDPFLEESEEK